MAETDGSTQKKICVACSKEFTGTLTTCPDDGTILTPLTETNLIGTVLGDRYEIQELIGDGAMGQVYKAKHRLLKRTVAVKMMHPNLVSGAAGLKRFQKEAELASALNHPNILTVYDFGVTDLGVPYLVMAYLEGTSLSTAIAGANSLELKRAIHIFKQVCLGLAHAHENGVVHRDLKPSNIMLVQLDADPDFVKIVDFGIAKLLTPAEGETDNLTRTGEVFGSPPYMSPEQCRAQPVDARSDIYSLGCVMYRALSGKQPITGHDLIEYLYKHVNEVPPSFDVVCPELKIPKEVAHTIFKALAKAPDDRFQSMIELRAALDEVYQTIPGETLTSTDIPRIVTDSDSGTQKSNIIESEPGMLTSSSTNNIGDTASGAAKNSVSVSLASPQVKSLDDGAKPVLHVVPEVYGVPVTAAALPATPAISAATALSPVSSSSETATANAKSDSGAEPNTASNSISQVSVPKSPKPTSTSSSIPPTSVAGAINISVAPPADTSVAGDLKVKTAALPKTPREKKDVTRPAILSALVLSGLIVTGLSMHFMRSLNSEDGKIDSLLTEARREYNAGQYASAKLKLRESIKLADQTNSPKNGDNHYLLGLIQYAQGNYDDAQANLEKARTIFTANGNDAIRIADCEAYLGRAATAMGQYGQAEKDLRHSLALRAENGGKAADSLTGLAYMHMKERKYASAVDELKQALTITEKATGADSQDTASALNDLGQAYQLAGNFREAEPLYRRALSIRKNHLDGSSPFIADSYNCLGALYASTGRLAEAKKYYSQALSIEQKSLSASDPRLAQTRQQYADLILKMGHH